MFLLVVAGAAATGCAGEDTLSMGITPAEHDVRAFPISDENPATASHQGLTCDECHASGPSFELNLCVDCHAALPFGLNPYERHRLVGGFEVSTPLCKTCHAENQLDRVNAHGPFKIDEPAPHHLESCIACHSSTREDKAWAVDFTKTDCRACHEVLEMAEVHEGTVEEYVSFDMPRCISCHEDGLVPPPSGGRLDAGRRP